MRRLENFKLKYENEVNCDREDKSNFVSVDFHPKEQWVLTATETHVYIHRVDGIRNDKVKEFVFENRIKIKQAIFCRGGEEIWVVTGDPGFHWCNIKDGVFKTARPNAETAERLIRKFVASPAGRIVAAVCTRVGAINLFSVKSKEVIKSLAHSSRVSDACFDPAGETLFSMTDAGEVYEWNIANKRCINKFQDEGNFTGSSISVSDKYVACGSNLGIVNLYDKSKLKLGGQPEVLKTFKNIATEIDYLRFNHDGTRLAFATSQRTNSFRMVYMPLMDVKHIPVTPNSAIYGHCGGMAFSPQSGYFIYSCSWRTTLCRLLNYDSY